MKAEKQEQTISHLPQEKLNQTVKKKDKSVITNIVEIDCLSYNPIKGSYFTDSKVLVDYLLSIDRHNMTRQSIKMGVSKSLNSQYPVCGKCFAETRRLKELADLYKQKIKIQVKLPKLMRVYNIDDIARQYEAISLLTGINFVNVKTFKGIVKDFFEIFWDKMIAENNFEYDFGFKIGKFYAVKDRYNRVRVNINKTYAVTNMSYTQNKEVYYKIYWDKDVKNKTVNKRTNLYYWRFNPPERVNRELALNSIEDNKGYKVRRTPPGFYDKDRLDDFIQTINKDIEW